LATLQLSGSVNEPGRQEQRRKPERDVSKIVADAIAGAMAGMRVREHRSEQ